MAEPVIVPVQLEVQDIEMDFNASEINKELRDSLAGVRKTLNDIFSEADPSVMNKAITKAMRGIERDLARAEVAQRQYNRTLVAAGKSTTEYADEVKELESARAELSKLGDQKDILREGFRSGNIVKDQTNLENYKRVLTDYYKQLRKVQELENAVADPANYAANSEDITTMYTAYLKVVNAIKQLNITQEAYNKTVKENQVTDEYTELVKRAEGYKAKLEELDAKAKKMEVIGATDKQWEALRYDTELVSKSMDDVVKKMRDAVKTGKAFRLGDGDKQGLSRQINSFAMSSRNRTGNIVGRAQKNESPYTKDYQAALDELDKLEKKMETIKAKSDKMIELGASKKQFQSLAYDAEQLNANVDEVKNRLANMVNEGKAFKFGSGDADAEMGKIQDKANGLQSVLSGVSTGAKKAQGGLTALGATHPKLAAVLTVASKIGSAFSKVGSAIAKGFAAGVKVMSKVTATAGKVASAFGRIAKGVFSAVRNLKIFGKSGSSTSGDMSKKFKKLTKNVLMFGFGFRTAYYAIKRLRNIFTESFKEMGKAFDEVGNPMATMIESFNRLKGSLATAFQPIVSVVMPILTRLMNYLTTMLEAIGKFNAALTGQGHIYKAVAKEIDSTTMSAKEANKQLGSYDKLEVIDKDSGDSDLGYSYEKQELDATSAASNFANMVKEAWAKADFTSVGAFVTEKLLGVLDSIETNILPKVTGFVNKVLMSVNTFLASFGSFDIGEKVGSLVNTLVSGIDWAQLGALFANINNTVWGFLDGLANGINWATLGTSLATGITSVFNTMKFEHWVGMISGFANGITTALYNMLTNVDWAGVAQQLGNTVNSLFTRIDIGQIGTTIKTLFDTLWSVIGNFFATVDWGMLATNIFAGINNIFSGDSAFNSSISSVASGLVTFIATAIQQIDWMSIVNTLWSGIQSVFSALGNALQSSDIPLFQAIGGIFGAVQEALDILVATALPVVVDLLARLMPIAERILNVVMALITPILQLIAPLVELVFNILDPVIAILMPILDIITLVAEVIGYVLTPILEMLNPVISVISSVFGTLGSVIKMIINVALQPIIDIIKFLVNLLMGVLKPAISVIQGIFNALCGVLEFVLDVFKSVFDGISEGFKKLWNMVKQPLNAILGGVESLANGVIRAINAMINALNKLSFDVPDWVPLIGGKKFGFNLKTLNEVKIPRLAQGAVIPPNKEFLAMLGDQKHGTNIEAPLDTIKQALAEVLAEVGGGTREPIMLQVNGRTLAQVVWDEQAKRYKQTGKYSPAY